jgi:hypothetical protein
MADLIIEFIFYMFDGVMDVITFSHWTRWQGDRIPNLKIKK